MHELEHGHNPPVDLGLVEFLQLQGKADVLGDGLVREQRQLLEHHAGRPACRRNAAHVLALDVEPPFGRFLETGQDLQQCGLAATGRTDESDELAGAHLKRNAVQRADPAVILDDVRRIDDRSCQCQPSSP